MAHSVECRVPFLDYRLVSLVFRSPMRWKMRGPWNKYLLREAMRQRIPESVRTRVDKWGFPVPQGKWISGAWYEPLQELLESRGHARKGYLQPGSDPQGSRLASARQKMLPASCSGGSVRALVEALGFLRSTCSLGETAGEASREDNVPRRRLAGDAGGTRALAQSRGGDTHTNRVWFVPSFEMQPGRGRSPRLHASSTSVRSNRFPPPSNTMCRLGPFESAAEPRLEIHVRNCRNRRNVAAGCGAAARGTRADDRTPAPPGSRRSRVLRGWADGSCARPP